MFRVTFVNEPATQNYNKIAANLTFSATVQKTAETNYGERRRP